MPPYYYTNYATTTGQIYTSINDSSDNSIRGFVNGNNIVITDNSSIISFQDEGITLSSNWTNREPSVAAEVTIDSGAFEAAQKLFDTIKGLKLNIEDRIENNDDEDKEVDKNFKEDEWEKIING